MLIDAKSKLRKSREDHKEHAINVHGPNEVEPSKDVYHGQDMVCIGWYLNLRYHVWRISPKVKALDEIFAALFSDCHQKFALKMKPSS